VSTASRTTAGLAVGGAHLAVALGEVALRQASADRRERSLDAVVAGRQALQGLLMVAIETPTTLGVGAGVDLAHLSSMLVLAALDPRRRRFGLREAALSGAFAAAEVWLWRRAASRP
jgi:hypothetical protein